MSETANPTTPKVSLTVKLRPCPFCGGEAKLGEANWTGVPKVECVNYGKWIEGKWHPELGCKVRPSTYTGNDLSQGYYAGKTEEQIIREIVAAWNGEPVPAATDQPSKP